MFCKKKKNRGGGKKEGIKSNLWNRNLEKNFYNKISKNLPYSLNTNQKTALKLETPARDLEPKLDSENTSVCNKRVQSSLQTMNGKILDKVLRHFGWLILPWVTSFYVPTRF